MVSKYVHAIEGRELNTRTGKVWSINDVGPLWNNDTRKKVLADGYEFLEDGTAIKRPINDEEESSSDE